MSGLIRQTFEEYVAEDALNFSLLKEMKRSPKHFRYRQLNDRPDSDTFRVGRAVHTAVLEPDLFKSEYVVYGERRAGKAWDEFRERNAGRTILTAEQHATALAMAEAVRSNPIAAKILRVGRAEHSLRWVDGATRLPCKARIDWLTAGAIVDLKGVRDISSDAMGRAMANYDYHVQLAHYRAGAAACGLGDLPAIIIAVEKEAPHDVAVFRVDDDALYAGEEVVGEWLATVKACTEADRWPGRYVEEQTLMLPRWAIDNDEDINGLGIVVGGKAV